MVFKRCVSTDTPQYNKSVDDASNIVQSYLILSAYQWHIITDWTGTTTLQACEVDFVTTMVIVHCTLIINAHYFLADLPCVETVMGSFMVALDKPYGCDVCIRAFQALWNGLESHMRLHFDDSHDRLWQQDMSSILI